MITTDTRHKIKVYTTPAYVEHFRLYLENKVVIKNNNLCFFCTQNIKESASGPSKGLSLIQLRNKTVISSISVRYMKIINTIIKYAANIIHFRLLESIIMLI